VLLLISNGVSAEVRLSQSTHLTDPVTSLTPIRSEKAAEKVNWRSLTGQWQ